MEINDGSPINKLVGIGERIDEKTKTRVPVTKFYFTQFGHVLRTFELYPVNKYFGLTPQTAMELPVDRWYQIKKSIEQMPPIKHIDMEAELLKLIKDMMAGGGGGE